MHTHIYISHQKFLWISLCNCQCLRMELHVSIKKISSTPICDHQRSGAVAMLKHCTSTRSWLELGEQLWEDVSAHRLCSLKKGDPAVLHEHHMTLFQKGQFDVSSRRSKVLDVQIFLLCLSMDSCISKLGLFFLCTCVERWNGSRYTRGASNTKGLSILIPKKE